MNDLITDEPTEVLSDFKINNIFADFLISCKVDVDNDSIINEVYAAMEKDKDGVTRTNRGGWHSKQFNTITPDPGLPSVTELAHQVVKACNKISQDLKLQHLFTNTTFWFNVNDENSYNIAHVHPKSEIACVYYAKAVEESGQLTILRCDGSMHNYLYRYLPQFTKVMVKPEVGRLYFFPAHLMHYVTSNASNSQRISIAFNIGIAGY